MRTYHRLTEDLAHAVRDLADTAAAHDGVAPLGEATLLALTRTGATHLVLPANRGIAGYAYATPESSELVVHPAHRGHGLGTRLAREVLTRFPATGIWAHHDLPAARAIARRLGLVTTRDLAFLRSRLTQTVPAHLPEGVSLRTFVPGADDDAWLALNAQAFAHHPEQGALDAADLADRMAQPWFDPTLFLLAERDGTLLGYAWGKVEDEPEVYVLGAHPPGTGVGGALLAHLLELLRERGHTTVTLYAEADAPAVRLYQRAGFHIASHDVQYGLTQHPSEDATMSP